MEKYSFFDAKLSGTTYDRTYSSSDLADYFASFIGNGVFANPANSLMVVAGSGLKVSVNVGKAFINGYFYSLSESNKSLSVSRGDNKYSRIDRVICSLNLSNRLIEVKVLKGTAAATPAAPAITRDSTRYDLVLAEIAVAAGCTAITDAMITDKRSDTSVCGFVSGTVKQIDTTDLFKQYDTSFNTWFDGMKGQLSTDAAGNIQTEIDSLTDSVSTNTTNIKKLNSNINDIRTTHNTDISLLTTNSITPLQTEIHIVENALQQLVKLNPSLTVPNSPIFLG